MNSTKLQELRGKPRCVSPGMPWTPNTAAAAFYAMAFQIQSSGINPGLLGSCTQHSHVCAHECCAVFRVWP